MSQTMYSLYKMLGGSPEAVLDAERAHSMTYSRPQQATDPETALVASR